MKVTDDTNSHSGHMIVLKAKEVAGSYRTTLEPEATAISEPSYDHATCDGILARELRVERATQKPKNQLVQYVQAAHIPI